MMRVDDLPLRGACLERLGEPLQLLRIRVAANERVGIQCKEFDERLLSIG